MYAPMNPEDCPPAMTPELEARINQLYSTCVGVLNEAQGCQDYYRAPPVIHTDSIARMMYYALAPAPSLLKMAGCDQSWLGGTEHMFNILMELSRYGEGPLNDAAVTMILGRALVHNGTEEGPWHVALGYAAYDCEWIKGSGPFFEWLRTQDSHNVIADNEDRIQNVLLPLDLHMQAGALFYEVHTLQCKSGITRDEHDELEKALEGYAQGMIKFMES